MSEAIRDRMRRTAAVARNAKLTGDDVTIDPDVLLSYFEAFEEAALLIGPLLRVIDAYSSFEPSDWEPHSEYAKARALLARIHGNTGEEG